MEVAKTSSASYGMCMKKIHLIATIIVIVGIGGLIALLLMQAKKPGKYDTTAQCITDSGAKFYGAWWCPHCQAQKAMFGKSAKKLPYIECQTPDSKPTKQCEDAGITKYPTWILPDNTLIPIESGSGVSLETLAAKTNCQAALDTDNAK